MNIHMYISFFYFELLFNISNIAIKIFEDKSDCENEAKPNKTLDSEEMLIVVFLPCFSN